MKNPKSLSLNAKSVTIVEPAQHSLFSISNYYPTITNTTQEILTKFIDVLIEYMRFISEKITIKNKQHYRFIFERGIETLIHIFYLIFYYTKNLDLTFYHTQKAYYFYIEFIEQISNDTVTFLQLSSRDAIMFVYKKTIFDLNNEYKKNISELTSEERSILSTVDSYTYIYKNIICFLIYHNDFTYEKKLEYVNNCCDKIKKMSETLNKNKIKKNYIECFYLFANLLADKKVEIDVFTLLLEESAKKLQSKKKLLDDKLIRNKIHEFEFTQEYEDNMHTLIDVIFSE
jgi:hypothetical protein